MEMRTYLIAVAMGLLVSGQLAAQQFEIKLSPLLLASVGAVAVEYGVNDEFGLEWDGIAAGGSFYTYFSGKYYFNPRKGLDRFYGGVFLGGGAELGAGLGFLLGTKILSRNEKVLFEIGVGLGRSLGEIGALPAGKLHFGYRI